jgi:mitogen-activated protein kinase kinase 3
MTSNPLQLTIQQLNNNINTSTKNTNRSLLQSLSIVTSTSPTIKTGNLGSEVSEVIDTSKSYTLNDEAFVRNDMAILSTGITMRDNTRTYVVDPASLIVGGVLGRGASSYVCGAKHRPTGIPLALKVISIHDRNRRAQLVNEIRVLYGADCDCLTSFYGAFLREGKIWLALEYMDCGTLNRVASLSPQRRLPEIALAGAAYQLLWALAYLRVEHLLHRDIKPSNVLVNSLGQIKLSDFGTSAELTQSAGMATTFTGTCKYMSPERIKHGHFSFPSDIWSVGMVILECAIGKYPYANTMSIIDAAEAISTSPPPTLPEDIRNEFTPEFEIFLSACLQTQPEDRISPDLCLQGSSWFAKHKIVDLASAILAFRTWLNTLPESSKLIIKLPV